VTGGARHDPATKARPTSFGRRSFLRGLGATGVGLAVLGARPDVASAAAPAVKFSRVYRLSTRGSDACHSCKAHGAHRFFRKPRFARQGRAHLGCDCRIVVQRIRRKQWKQYFRNPDGSLRGEWDDRW